MARIRGCDTGPERMVRSIVRRLGYRFRTLAISLPGTPDLVLPDLRQAILIHGCFWHQHQKCPRSARPRSNIKFWNKKLEGNVKRDRRVMRELRRLGWSCLVVWECELRSPQKAEAKIRRFLTKNIARGRKGRIATAQTF